jgi:hypothetical protein
MENLKASLTKIIHFFAQPGTTLILIALLFSWAVWQNRSKLLQTINAQEVGQLYSASQYVLGEASENWVGDDVVYQFAALEYAQGKNPTLVNFEHPPLGKYFFGLSWLLFNNTLIINLFLYLLLLYAFYRLAKLIIGQTAMANLALLSFGSLRLVRAHLGETLLDLQMLLWTVLFFVFLFKRFSRPVLKYVCLGISLGFLIATKYFFPLIGLYALALLFYWFKKDRQLPHLVIAGLTAVGIYLLSYIAYFAAGHNLVDWLKFELYRFHWWTGNRDFPRLLILHSIYLGKFKAWWAENTYEYAAYWSFLWPLFCSLHFIMAPVLHWNWKRIILFSFSTLFLVLLAAGGANNSRYVLQLIPFWIIFTFAGVKQEAKELEIADYQVKHTQGLQKIYWRLRRRWKI